MPSTGYLQIRAYASIAQLPLKDVAISVTAKDGALLLMDLTDRSGLTKTAALPAPARSESQTPNPGQLPFSQVDLHARIRGYEQITVRNIQVFPDTTTLQELELIPLAEHPQSWNKSEEFDTSQQTL